MAKQGTTKYRKFTALKPMVDNPPKPVLDPRKPLKLSILQNTGSSGRETAKEEKKRKIGIVKRKLRSLLNCSSLASLSHNPIYAPFLRSTFLHVLLFSECHCVFFSILFLTINVLFISLRSLSA